MVHDNLDCLRRIQLDVQFVSLYLFPFSQANLMFSWICFSSGKGLVSMNCNNAYKLHEVKPTLIAILCYLRSYVYIILDLYSLVNASNVKVVSSA